MSAVVQSIIIAIIGLILAVFLGSEVGTGFRIVPLSLAIIAVLFGVYKLFFKAIRVEALLLGLLLFGYVVGNRGFAQLSLAPNTPLYLGEIGMLACIGILCARLALKREQVFPKTRLSWAIVAFLLIGAIRLCCDLFLNVSAATTVMTIRDSATVYYALFFFIAYKVGSNAVGRQLVERFVLAACILLVPVFLIQFVFAPDLFNRMTFRGYPIIYHKGDLTSTYLAFASFYFFLQPAKGLIRLFLRILAVLFFLGMFIVTARAAIVGYTAAVLLLLLARRPQFPVIQLAVGVVAIIIAAIVHIGGLTDQNDLYTKLADKVESITDVSGNGSYRGDIGDAAADNNQFRLVWWKNVFDETLHKGPLLGLGFGYDLSAGFLRSYYANQQPNWDTRSPHSIWVTILGRMGAIGLMSFIAIVAFMIREAAIAARLVARGKADAFTLAFWTGAIIILCSASFGVVLEGPMGGVLFWTFLGLASSQLNLQMTSMAELSPEPSKKRSPSNRRLVPA